MLAALGLDRPGRTGRPVAATAIRQTEPLDLPPALTESQTLAELRGLAEPEPAADADDRPGLPRHHHAVGDPPQRAGDPGLVHRLHAVPARDQPGPAGGPAQLPDHGLRPDRAADRRRQPAGRGHGRRRGDDAGPAHAPRPGTVLLLDADTLPQTIAVVRTRAAASASRSWSPTARCATRSTRSTRSACWCRPRAPAAGCRHRRARAPSPTPRTRRGALVIAACDLLALTLLPPRGSGAPTSRSAPASGSAYRCSTADRTPASSPSAPGWSARCPGGWSGCPGDADGPGVPARPADPRAAHPPGEGDLATSAPPRCCWRSWPSMYAVYHGPDGLREHRRRDPRRRRGAGRRPGGRRRRGRARRVLRHRARRGARPGRRRGRRRRGSAGSTCAWSMPTTSAISSARTRPRAISSAVCDGLRASAERRARPVGRRSAGSERTTRYLTHPVFNTHHSETAMLRYLRALSDRTSRSTAA